jgi:DNA polymerase-3 subunit alpha
MCAENTPGMHNLFRLSSLASLEGYFYKPRVDRELLSRYADGLIATTGCPGGEVQTYLRLGRYQDAIASAAEFRDLFGAGNYFVELMDHGLSIEDRVRADLLKIAKDLKLPLVATNDLHYTHQSDAAAHEVLLCVQTGSTMADGNRFKFEGDQHLPQVTSRDARDLRRTHRHATTYWRSPSGAISPSPTTAAPICRATPLRGRPRTPGSCMRSKPDASALSAGIPDTVRKRPTSDQRDHFDGLRGIFPRGCRLHQLGERRGIRVETGRVRRRSIAAYAMRFTDLDLSSTG